jgi:hypothetical protein
MSTLEPAHPQSPVNPQRRIKGEIYESIAFTFCKAATIILLTQRFALPVAAGAAAVFYILVDVHGKKDTRCILKKPWLIAGFWGTVCVVSLYLILRAMFVRGG